jgi:hypothetical protein
MSCDIWQQSSSVIKIQLPVEQSLIKQKRAGKLSSKIVNLKNSTRAKLELRVRRNK